MATHSPKCLLPSVSTHSYRYAMRISGVLHRGRGASLGPVAAPDMGAAGRSVFGNRGPECVSSSASRMDMVSTSTWVAGTAQPSKAKAANTAVE